MRPTAIAFVLAAALLLSIGSGYQNAEISRATAWSVSPVGLLSGSLGGIWEMRNSSGFPRGSGITLDYFFVFLKTCLLELPFYFLVFRSMGWASSAASLLTANFLTHPLVFFVFPHLTSRYGGTLLASEAFAAVAEVAFALAIRDRIPNPPPKSACAVLIVAANLFSWQVGVFL